MYCVRVFAVVYVFVCTIVVCGCIYLYYVPPMRKSGCADHCEVKSSSINQSITVQLSCGIDSIFSVRRIYYLWLWVYRI